MMMSVEIRVVSELEHSSLGFWRNFPALLDNSSAHAEDNSLGNLQSNYMRCIEQLSDCR